VAKLIIKSRDGTVKEHELRAVTGLGRQSTNDIQLSEELASRQHARIIPSGRAFVIEDLQSANGTFVNGQKIQRRVLADGDLIRIGGCELVFRDDAAKDLVGELVSDRYRVMAKLGSGGMGTVYKALQISMDRQVALKVLNPELTRDREFVVGFLNEARTAGQLNHPNIIQVHDFGEFQGLYYFSMELVEGENVLSVMSREGKIPVARALTMISQLADALAHAHAHNIVHQDIKPQNLMLDKRFRDQVKLADLGLAKVIGSDKGVRRGALMGTPHYMAPEQAKGLAIDGRTDLYSAGATLFHMLTGRVPYEGRNSIEILTKHVKNEVPDPRQYDVSIPESVAKLTMRLLAKEPAARFQSAKELGDAVRAILAKERAGMEHTAARKPAVLGAAPRPQVRRIIARRPAAPSAAPWIVACLFLAGLVGALLWFFVFRGRLEGGAEGTGGTTQGRPGALSEAQAAALLRRVDALILQARFDEAEETCRQIIAGAPSGPAAAAATARLGDIALKRRGTSAGSNEAAAQAELDEILKSVGDKPAELAEAQRRLQAFLARRGGARCAVQARARLEEVTKAMTSAAAGSQADREKAAREAYRNELARARAFEEHHDFRAAERTLLDFAAMHTGTAAAADAKKIAGEMRDLAENILKSLFEDAERAGKSRKYRQAAEGYSQVISRDPESTWGQRAREALAAQDSATEATCKEAMTKAMDSFRAFSFTPASRTADRAAEDLLGTRWQGELERLSMEAAACAKLHAAMAKKITGSGVELPLPFKIKGPDGWEYAGRVVSATPEAVSIKGGPAIIPKPWKELAPQDLAKIYLGYVVPDEHHLAASYLFARLGLKEEAKGELRRALAVPATAEVAGARLAELEGRANLLAYDFSSGLQVSDWQVLSGVWGLEEGELAGGGPGESVIELRRQKYAARGLRVSLEFTVKPDKAGEGPLSIELYAGEQSYLGVTFDPRQGTEISAAVNGAPARSPDGTKLAGGKRHSVKLAVSGGSVEVTADGVKLPALKVPQVEGLSGHLRIKLLDGRAAIDNVQVRNEAE
jgi:pSer/pThr/pTyr-binding forkhead associated (FHA) protein